MEFFLYPEFPQMIARELAKYAKIIKASGAKVD